MLNYLESKKEKYIIQSLIKESIINNRELNVYMFNPHGNIDTSSHNVETNQASSSNNIPFEGLLNNEADNARIARMEAVQADYTNRFNAYINRKKTLDRNAAIIREVGNYVNFVPAYNLSKDLDDDNASIATCSTRFEDLLISRPNLGPSYLFDNSNVNDT